MPEFTFGRPPPANEMSVGRLMYQMVTEFGEDIKRMQRRQQELFSLFQNYLRSNYSEQQHEPLGNEMPVLAPRITDHRTEHSGTSALYSQDIKSESPEENKPPARPLLQSGQKRSAKKRLATNTPYLRKKVARRSLSSDSTEVIVEDRKYYVWASEDKPYATNGPYEGDPEVEQAIFLDTNSISCYASRLGNYIFAGLPEMQYQMLPHNKRVWLNSKVEQRYPPQEGEDRQKYTQKWRKQVVPRRIRTIDRLETIAAKTQALLNEDSISKTGGSFFNAAMTCSEALNTRLVPRNLEHEAYLNTPDELHYTMRLSDLLWPETCVPPSSIELNLKDERIQYLKKALDERYPVLMSKSKQRFMAIAEKARNKVLFQA